MRYLTPEWSRCYVDDSVEIDSDEFREAEKRMEEASEAHRAWQKEIAPHLPADLRLTNHLHDARLQSVLFKPEERACILDLDGYYYLEGGDVPARYNIRLEGVTEVAFIENPYPRKVPPSLRDEVCDWEHDLLEDGSYRWCILMCESSEIRFTFTSIETKIEPPRVVEYTTYAEATKELPELERISKESSFDFHISHCFKDLSEPNISLLCCDKEWAEVMGSRFEQNHSKTRVLRIRGDKMATLGAALEECSAACQFPTAGEDDLDGFAESMGDLQWLGAPNILLVLIDVEKALSNEPIKGSFLFDSIHQGAALLKRKAAEGSQSITMHCVLHSSTQVGMDSLAALLAENNIPFRSALEYNRRVEDEDDEGDEAE